MRVVHFENIRNKVHMCLLEVFTGAAIISLNLPAYSRMANDQRRPKNLAGKYSRAGADLMREIDQRHRAVYAYWTSGLESCSPQTPGLPVEGSNAECRRKGFGGAVRQAGASDGGNQACEKV